MTLFGLCAQDYFSRAGHELLDWLGFIFDPADAINFLWYTAEGNAAMAAATAVAIVPAAGSFIAKGTKQAIKAGKKAAQKAGEKAAKNATEKAAKKAAKKKLAKEAGKEAAQKGAEKAAKEAAEKGIKSGKSSATQKTYQTYTKKNPISGEVYSGRTSGYNTPAENVARRDLNQKKKKKGYLPAQLDKTSTDYNAIRGREQMLIEANGGAKSVGGTSGNAINGISPNNKKKNIYINAAKKSFGEIQ